MRKVRIKTVPKFGHGGKVSGDQTPPTDKTANPSLGSYDGGNDPEIKINETLKPTSREHSNLEAELGETVITNLQGEGIPEFYKISGKRHYNGGTPLNLPPNSFIFSRDNKMMVKNEDVLNMFGKTKGKKNKGFTPAELSKSYNLNKYREILMNPLSDHIQRDTAEMMIQNYNVKLGALALLQESMKGMSDGIPAVAMPYLETMGVDPASLVGPEAGPPAEVSAAAYGGQFKRGGAMKRKVRIKKTPKYKSGGGSSYDTKRKVDSEVLKKRGESGRFVSYAPEDWAKEPAIRRLNKKLKISGFKPLTGNVTPDMIRETTAALQDYNIENFEPVVIDYMLYNSDKPTNKMIEIMKNRGMNDFSQKALIKAYKDGIISAKDIDSGFGDGSWDYRMPTTTEEKISEKELAEKLKNKDKAVKVGDKYYFKDDPDDPDAYTAYYAEPKKEESLETKPAEYDTAAEDPKAKFWRQDLNNMRGAAVDLLGLKKYSPWQAEPMFEEAQPTFTDFTGTANRIQAQAQGATDAAATFADPRAYAANAAKIQAGAMDPILKAMEMENQVNVGVANQFEMANTQAKNQFNMTKAGLDTQLYDKTVMANQQFDNSKRALRKNLRDAFNQGWTNRGMTQTMNEMRPQYSVDPSTGFTTYTGIPSEIVAGSASNPTRDYENQVAAILKRHTDWTPQDAMNLIKNQQAGVASAMKNRPNQSLADYASDYPPGYPGAQGRQRRRTSQRRQSQ